MNKLKDNNYIVVRFQKKMNINTQLDNYNFL